MDAVLREVAEASASGRVAELYADIRRVLGVPFVVLIYRVLANDLEPLERVWSDLSPNLASDYGRAAAAELGAACPAGLDPVPATLLQSLDPAATAATLQGYRRANSTNLVGLTALLDGVEGPAPTGTVRDFPRPLEIALPMADLRTLAPETTELLERMSVPVAGAERPVLVPSLFRCFAHDHDLLAALWERLRPELESPRFAGTVEATGRRARVLAAGFPYRVGRLEDDATRETVARFARTLPGMLVAGSLLEEALALLAPEK